MTTENISALNQAAYVIFDEYHTQLEKLNRYHKRPPTGAFNWGTGVKKGRGKTKGKADVDAIQRIAQTCVNNSIDAREYVSVMFPVVRAKVRILHPSDFTEPWVLAEYQRLRKGRQTDQPAAYWGMFLGQVAQIRRLNPNIPSDAAVMRIAPLDFPPWFRVMFPPPPVEDLVMRFYGEPAWHELRQDRKLRDFLRKTRPENFRLLEQRFCAFGDTIE